jgi:hypothetical protein
MVGTFSITLPRNCWVQRLGDDGDDAAVPKLRHLPRHLALANRRHDLLDELVRIGGHRGLRDPVRKNFTQRNARLHEFRRQAVHARVLGVADHESGVCVEHDDALRYIVGCGCQLQLLRVERFAGLLALAHHHLGGGARDVLLVSFGAGLDLVQITPELAQREERDARDHQHDQSGRTDKVERFGPPCCQRAGNRRRHRDERRKVGQLMHL